MRFKIDENLHDGVQTILAGHGHDVQSVHDEGLRGCNDTTLAAHCIAENRTIVTLDLDFADIREILPTHPGVIVLRVRDQSRKHVADVISRLPELLKKEPVAGQLWIVSDAGVRIRKGL